jgi:predicted enzyme related to lactoylglutathione lyase
MSQPVVHFEIIGAEPAKLREYYAALFGWEFQVGDATTDAVSRPGEYGFINGDVSGGGINGGVGGGAGFTPRVLFYVGVPDVEAALRKAEELGGRRVLGPARAGGFAVGHFTDPEGNLVGVAGQEESR